MSATRVERHSTWLGSTTHRARQSNFAELPASNSRLAWRTAFNGIIAQERMKRARETRRSKRRWESGSRGVGENFQHEVRRIRATVRQFCWSLIDAWISIATSNNTRRATQATKLCSQRDRVEQVIDATGTVGKLFQWDAGSIQ